MGTVDMSNVVWDRAAHAFDAIDIDWEAVHGKVVAITGATGLIGSQLVRALLVQNDHHALRLHLMLPIRRPERAAQLFGAREDVTPVSWEFGEKLDLPGHVDWFVHAACTTSSRDFSERPVETALGIIDGTAECLFAARSTGVNAFTLLSTMEVYGEPTKHPVTEDALGYLDPMSPRNSYPLAKLAAENLVASFGAECGMRTSVLRLAQTFGVGVKHDDARVFAEFARDAESGEDIVLLSDGSKRNSYLSVNDAVSAVVTTLVDERAGGVYNAANPATYCSILEMAQFVLSTFGSSNATVRFGVDEKRSKTFRKGNDLDLDASRLRSLGWAPRESLVDMYQQLLDGWRA